MKISRREFTALTSSVLAAIAAPKAMGQAVRIRRNINSLSAAEIATFKAGVSAMKGLPIADHGSFSYQACVWMPPWAWEDIPGLPADATTYWDQAEMWNLHFLPFTRWYLFFWEEFVRQACGSPDFDLPYWDPVGDPFLPAAFRVPMDVSNPLFDPARMPDINSGAGGIDGASNVFMGETDYSLFTGNNTVGQGIHWDPLHTTRHQLGGWHETERMAFDPVFYSMHCNMDRMWECWLRMGGGRANPGMGSWLTKSWNLPTVSGIQTAVTSHAEHTLDLGYEYDSCPTFWHLLIPDFYFEEILPWWERLPPFPDPPPPWERIGIASDPIILTGQNHVRVLERSMIERARFTDSETLGLLMQDIEATELVRQAGFYLEAWLAPSEAHLKEKKLQGAVRLGSLGPADMGYHSEGGFEQKTLRSAAISARTREGAKPSVAMGLNAAAKRMLLDKRNDPCLVFVRRGLKDRKGQPLPFERKAELFRIGSLSIAATAHSGKQGLTNAPLAPRRVFSA
jgi:hypothetical protein